MDGLSYTTAIELAEPVWLNLGSLDDYSLYS